MNDDQTSETPMSNHSNYELAGAALSFDCSLGHDVGVFWVLVPSSGVRTADELFCTGAARNLTTL